MKKCNGCGEIKPRADFNKRAASLDGLQHECRECSNKNSRAWRQKNPVRARELSRIQTDRLRERNPSYHTEYARTLYAKQYATEEGRAKLIAKVENRRALQTVAEGFYTAKEFLALCASYRNMCLACEEVKPLTADHVIPLSKGGTNWISNIQPLCRSCNCKKGVKDTDYRQKFCIKNFTVL